MIYKKRGGWFYRDSDGHLHKFKTEEAAQAWADKSAPELVEKIVEYEDWKGDLHAEEVEDNVEALDSK